MSSALREALEETADCLRRFHLVGERERAVLRKAKAALLVSPMRNCDRFSTPEEAHKAFYTQCVSRPTNCDKCPFAPSEVPCFFGWLYAPAEGKSKSMKGKSNEH